MRLEDLIKPRTYKLELPPYDPEYEENLTKILTSDPNSITMQSAKKIEEEIFQKLSEVISDEIDDALKNMTNTILPDYLLEDPQVVGYPDLEMQESLYSYALMGVLPLVQDPINPMSVVDIGAGRGDLRAFLDTNYPGFQYYGYELNSIHRNIAKQKYEIELINEEFSRSTMNFHGWGFCIGSLNDDYGLFIPNSPDSKFTYFGHLLDACIKKISEGVVFILLNETSPEQENLIPFPMPEMVEFLDSNYPDLAFQIDYSKFQGIYKLVIYNQRLQA
jgi:hypothetical protein